MTKTQHKLPHLEVSVDAIKSLGVLRQLVPDVLRANEDRLQVRPCSLNLQVNGNNLVSCGQLLLPCRHLSQEVGNVLGGHHVLKLHLSK